MEEASWFDNPKLVQRPGCVCQAYGMGFEPEAFLRDTTFDRKLILFHGELNLPEELKRKVAETDLEALAVFETAYLLMTISDAGQSAVQLAEATAFLRRNRDELKRLSRFPQVEMVALIFRPAEGEPPLKTLPDDVLELSGDIMSIMF